MAAITTTFLLNACGPDQQLLSCDLSTGENNSVLAANQKSEAIKISVLVDGTLSMQGYVNGLTNSQYIKTLKLIDSVSSTNWIKSKSDVKYYRFGTKKNLISRETYLRAQLPQFYGNGTNLEVSRIDTAMPSASQDHLSIVLTDLYQKDADVTRVRNELNQSYLRKGYAVGILAIKSEFNGMIYDVGVKSQKLSYTTKDKSSDKQHPFYIMLLGSYPNVSYFFNQLKQHGSDLIKNDQFVIFYPQPVHQTSFLNSNIDSHELPKNLRHAKALNDGNVLVKVKEKQPVELFIVNNRLGEQNIRYELPYHLLPNTLSVSSAGVSINTKPEKYNNKSNNFEAVDTEGFQLSNWKVTAGKETNFLVNLQPKDMEKGIYRFTTNVYPLELKEPAWWSSWSSNEDSMDGSKTNNLLSFLRDLKLSTTELMKAEKPTIAHLCYAIQKK